MFDLKNLLDTRYKFLAFIIISILTLIVINVFVIYNANKKIEVVIDSEPSGATVKINNITGVTPLKIELKGGQYNINLSKEYYKNSQEIIKVSSKNSRFTFELTKSYVIPYADNKFSIDCQNIADIKVCDINIYEEPINENTQKATDYLKRAGIDMVKTKIIYNTPDSGGGIPG